MPQLLEAPGAKDVETALAERKKLIKRIACRDRKLRSIVDGLGIDNKNYEIPRGTEDPDAWKHEINDEVADLMRVSTINPIHALAPDDEDA